METAIPESRDAEPKRGGRARFAGAVACGLLLALTAACAAAELAFKEAALGTWTCEDPAKAGTESPWAWRVVVEPGTWTSTWVPDPGGNGPYAGTWEITDSGLTILPVGSAFGADKTILAYGVPMTVDGDFSGQVTAAIEDPSNADRDVATMQAAYSDGRLTLADQYGTIECTKSDK